MNWYSQLTRLILDFYREDLPQRQQLHPLWNCTLSRRWGTLRIKCRDQETANALVEAGALLKAPIAQLRIAQQIHILMKGHLVATLPIHPSKSKDVKANSLKLEHDN